MDTAVLKRILSAIDPQVTDWVISAVAPLFTRQVLPAGQSLLLPGQIWGQAIVIQSGLIRLYFLRWDGREFNKNFFGEDSLLCPLTPAMWEEPSLFGVACIEPTVIWHCNAAVFRQLLVEQQGWERIQRELLAQLLTAKLQREHDLLTLDGRRRYERFLQRFPEFAQRIPLLHLATYLGLTDVSLSRLRRQMREQLQEGD